MPHMNDGAARFKHALGDTQMASAIASFDWSATGLGPVEDWDSSLRSAVAFVARSPAAAALLWGPRGILVYNDPYAEILGSKPQALGQSVLDVWPEAAEFNALVIGDALAGAPSRFADAKFSLDRGAGPRDAWFDLHYVPAIDGEGRVFGAIAIVVETTDAALARADADGERARFAELFEQAPTFMAVLRGPQHRYEMVNPSYINLVGGREVVGSTVAGALPEAAAQGFVALLDEVYSSGQAFRGSSMPFELQDRQGHGSTRYLDFVYQPIRGAGGEVEGVFVEGFDVTDRLAAEKAASESKSRDRQIIDSATDYAIVATNLDGLITQWNEGAVRVLGWSEEEMLGQPAERFFTPEDRASGRIDEEMRLALAHGAASDERWHLRKSGERFWASGEMSPLRASSGEAIGFVKVLRDRTEQHVAGERLRESEERLRRAQEAGGIGTFTLDIATNRIGGTAEFWRLYGLPAADSYPASALEALVDPAFALIRSSQRTREDASAPTHAEYPITRADDGRRRWLARSAEFVHGDAGPRMNGVVQDVTERRAARDLAEQNAEQFRLLAEALPSHVWTARADGMLDWFNARVYEYSGARPGELDGGGWAALLHPDDAEAAAALWAAKVTSGEIYEAEFRIRRRDGAYRWHLARALPVSSAGGVSRWIGTNTDIDDAKRAQDEVQTQRDRIWTLSRELMLVCDFEGRIADVNPAAESLLGWPRESMMGELLSKFIHPDDAERTAREVARLADGQSTLSFENRYRASDGSYRLLSWTAVPDRGFIHGQARDVTRERAAEEALRQSQKLEAVGQLTGGVAHDFNNMLGIIKMSMDLLQMLPAEDPRRARPTRSIFNAIEQATKLTGQLLAFARQQNLRPEVFDAGARARDAAEMISTVAGARVEVALDLAEEPCHVLADPAQFTTAVVNLAVNARDAMPQGGRMLISVREVDGIPARGGDPAISGDFVAISVADSGVGIPPENLGQIFEPFFTTKPVGAGTGLGLSQVFGFAKQSGGDIRARSVVGSGSDFTLYLPRAAAAQAPAAARAPEASPARRARVLVVEDNADLAESVELTLAELGYETTVARGAEEALDILAEPGTKFDAMFSDVVMPGIGGLELGRRARELYPEMAVLLTSGYSEELANAREKSFPLLPKPYALADLSKALASAISGAARQPAAMRRLTPGMPL